MNIALPALIVFLVLLPGFIARAQVQRIEKQQLDYSPFGAVVTEALLLAAALHLLWLAGMSFFCSKELDAAVLLGLLSSNQSLQAEAIAKVSGQIYEASLYFGTLLIGSYAGAKFSRWLITKYRLDREGAWCAAFFRFNAAPWYYLLSGADFDSKNVPDLIRVSAVLEVGKEAYLYVGVLDSYEFGADGKLDRLILSEVQRRQLDKDKPSDADADSDFQRFYPVDGDFFVIKYDEVNTLNFQYVKLEEYPENS